MSNNWKHTMMNHWWGCGMCQIAQQGGIFAEWAFGAHVVDQEVKMNCCHGDRRKGKQTKRAWLTPRYHLLYCLFFFCLCPFRFLHIAHSDLTCLSPSWRQTRPSATTVSMKEQKRSRKNYLGVLSHKQFHNFNIILLAHTGTFMCYHSWVRTRTKIHLISIKSTLGEKKTLNHLQLMYQNVYYNVCYMWLCI